MPSCITKCPCPAIVFLWRSVFQIPFLSMVILQQICSTWVKVQQFILEISAGLRQRICCGYYKKSICSVQLFYNFTIRDNCQFVFLFFRAIHYRNFQLKKYATREFVLFSREKSISINLRKNLLRVNFR